MSELKTSLSFGRSRWFFQGAGAGAGVAVAGIVVRALIARPEFLPQLLNGQVLFFSALVFGMVVMKGEFRDFNANNLRGVIANEKLAANVGALVDKDDARERRMDLLLGELTRTSENTATSLRRIESWIDGQRKASD